MAAFKQNVALQHRLGVPTEWLSGDEVRRWLRQCEEMRAVLRTSRVPLAGVSDVARDLAEIGRRGRPAEPNELYRIVDLIRAGMSLRALFVSKPEAVELAWVARDSLGAQRRL